MDSTDRSLATIFDSYPDRYWQARPSYPPELVEAVLQYAALPPSPRLLEIGSGPGNATKGFARFGHRITAVEPGSALVEAARRNFAEWTNVEFQASKFEDWEDEDGTFNLIYSGQAFHWVDPEVGYPKLLRLLRPGGAVALFRNNQLLDDSELERELFLFTEAANGRAPSTEGYQEKLDALARQGLDELHTRGFVECEMRKFPWKAEYDADSYAMLQSTYSEVAVMEPERQRRTLDDYRDILGRYGGKLTMSYEALLLLGRRGEGGRTNR